MPSGGSVTGLGTTHRARVAAKLVAKEPGRHRWIAVVAYVLDDEHAAAAPARAWTARAADVLDFGVACYDCEGPYESVNGKPCGSPDAESVPMNPPPPYLR